MFVEALRPLDDDDDDDDDDDEFEDDLVSTEEENNVQFRVQVTSSIVDRRFRTGLAKRVVIAAACRATCIERNRSARRRIKYRLECSLMLNFVRE